MKKFLNSVIIVLIAHSFFAQNQPLTLIKYNEKIVTLKCVAKDYAMLSIQLDQGMEVSRIESQTMLTEDQLPVLNYEIGVKTIISPAIERFKKLSESNADEAKILALLEPFLGAKVKDAGAKNFSFGMAIIESSISKKINSVMGTIHSDNTVEKNKIYVYRIRIKGLNDAFILINTNRETQAFPMTPIFGKLENKKTIELSWDAKSLNKNYLGFILERKKENSSFVEMLDEPYIHVVSSSEKKDKMAFLREDSLKQGVKYTYKVTPIDYFGDKQKSSNEIEIYIPKLTNAQIYIDTIYAKDTKRFASGKIEKSNKDDINIVKMQVLRSKKNFTDFTFLKNIELQGLNFQFDYSLEIASGDAYYYKVIGISKDNDTCFSNAKYFFTLDQIPPLSPKKILGKIDMTGKVSLSWNANSEDDIQGYRVYRANSKKEEFVEMTRILETKIDFKDTLALDNLTSEMYYFIVAVDDNYNNSIHSDTILVMKPDTIPPVKPQITDLEIIKKQVTLKVRPSSSSDVTSYFLLRRLNNTKPDTIQKFVTLKNSVIDSTVSNSTEYFYQLGCFDKSKNSSTSKVQNVIIETGLRDSLIVNISLDRINKEINIIWIQPSQKVDHYTVYKGENGKKIQLFKTLDADQHSFKDNDIEINTVYYYHVKYTTKEGFSSEKHVPRKINY